MRIRFKPWARPELEASEFYRDNPEELKGKWIQEFKNKEKEKFIFAVTIQNHGGYNSSRFNNDEMVQLGSELNTYTDAREYLTLIQKADQALESLFTYFEKIYYYSLKI